MRRRTSIWARSLALLGIGLWIATPSFGAGFGIFEQGARAMGMAGAFTAQADDPSAMWHNAAGLAFQKERDFAAGFTWIRSLEADFEGADPFPGEGVKAELETLSEFPPHAYWVEPLGERWTFGLGLMSPFGLVTEWQNPDTFPGRFISSKGQLTTIDINPNLAVQLSENLSVGFGAIARFSEVELRRAVALSNPFTQTVSDVGRIVLESDLDDGFGFNFGILHKANSFFNWGLSYRSEIEVEYGGDGVLTQVPTGNPQLDAVVAASLPFDRDLPVATRIDFPQMASLGLAFRLSERTMLEADINWTGWDSFDELPLDFVNDDLPDATIPERWDNAMNYRLGLAFDTAGGKQWRLGAVYDETPQPEEAISPLLPDANRLGLTIGYGFQGPKYSLDLAFMYLLFDDSIRETSFPEEGDFLGEYQTTGALFGVTFGF